MASRNAKIMSHQPPRRSQSGNRHQPNSSYKNQENPLQTEICIQRVPTSMKENELQKMITQFGKVKNFHKSHSPSCSYYFAECLSKK